MVPARASGAPPLPNEFRTGIACRSAANPFAPRPSARSRSRPLRATSSTRPYKARRVSPCSGYFTIKYRDNPISVSLCRGPTRLAHKLQRSTSSLIFPGLQPALLAHFYDASSNGACYLLVDQPNVGLKVEPVAGCGSLFAARPLTSDTTTFREGAERRQPRGRIHRLAFEKPGLYLLTNAVFDSRCLGGPRGVTVRLRVPFSAGRPPLGVSPDERSFAWFGDVEHRSENPVLLVTDVVAERRYIVPIDAKRMRFATLDVLDPGVAVAPLRMEAWPVVATTIGQSSNGSRLDPVSRKAHVEHRLERVFVLSWLVTLFVRRSSSSLSWSSKELRTEDGLERVPDSGDGRRSQGVRLLTGSSFNYVSIALDHGDTNLVLVQQRSRSASTISSRRGKTIRRWGRGCHSERSTRVVAMQGAYLQVG